MPVPSPDLLLAVAQQIDFDPAFRRAVAEDPVVALTAAGLDNATAMALLSPSADGGSEVELFAGAAALVAMRAHRWAMALLRSEGRGQEVLTECGPRGALALLFKGFQHSPDTPRDRVGVCPLMTDHTEQLAEIADRIETDEDFAMRIGEDARSALESEGLPDPVIAAILTEAEADVVGFAMPDARVSLAVTRIAQAVRTVAAS